MRLELCRWRFVEYKVFFQHAVDARHVFLNGKGSIHGASHVIVMFDGHIEKRHGGVSEQAIDDAIMLNDDLRGGLKKFRSDGSEFFDSPFVRKTGVFPAIGE